MTDTTLMNCVVRRLWQLLTLSLLAGIVQAQTTTEKPSLENAPAPGGPVVISTYPFVQGENIDTAWVDAETVLFGVGWENGGSDWRSTGAVCGGRIERQDPSIK